MQENEELTLGSLGLGDFFRFPGKKAIYRVLAATNMYIQYENTSLPYSLYEKCRHHKAWDQPVELVNTDQHETN